MSSDKARLLAMRPVVEFPYPDIYEGIECTPGNVALWIRDDSNNGGREELEESR